MHLFRKVFGVSILLLLVMSSFASFIPNASGQQATTTRLPSLFGPRIDEILFPIILGPEQQALSLRNDQVDVIESIVLPKTLADLSADRNINVTIAPQYHFFYVGFNFRAPTLDNKILRQAIAHVTPKADLSRALFGGIVTPVDTFVAPATGFEWLNTGVKTFQYSPAAARDLLDRNGWRLDTASGFRIDPTTGRVMREIALLTPTAEEAPTSAEIGKRIAEEARAVGLRVKAEPTQFATIVQRITSAEPNFDMWVLAWVLGARPAYLYDFFHSSQAIPDANNLPGIKQPALDKALEELKFSPTEAGAIEGGKKAQAILSEELPYVPLYSRLAVNAWRSNWVDHWNWRGIGSVNGYSWLNVHKKGQDLGGTVRFALSPDIRTLSPTVSRSHNEVQVWGLVYDSLLSSDRVDAAQPTPGLAKSWEIGVFSPKPGRQGQLITFELEEGIVWQDGEPFTAEDIQFTILFYRDTPVPQYLSSVENILDVKIIGENKIEVSFNSTSFFHLFDVGGLPILPKHIWKAHTADWNTFRPWETPHPTVPGLTQEIGTGAFIYKERKPGEFVRVVRNPLYWMGLGSRAATATVSTPERVAVGEPMNLRASLQSATGTPISNANVTFLVFDKATKGLINTFKGRSTDSGRYEATINSTIVGSGERQVKAAFLWEKDGISYLLGASPREVGGKLPRKLLYIRDPTEISSSTLVIPEFVNAITKDVDRRISGLSGTIDDLKSQLSSSTQRIQNLQSSIDGLKTKLQESESRGNSQLIMGLAAVLILSIIASVVLSRRRAG